MRLVYFVQCKYPADKVEFINMLERWNYYGSILSLYTSKRKIAIVSPRGVPNLDKDFEFLRFRERKKGFIRNLYSVIREMKQHELEVTLVSGDNQLSLLFCILLSFLFRKKVSIQTQFHGDLYSRQANLGFRGIFRVITSHVAIRFSNSIRIVSRFQEMQLREFFPNIKSKFIVAPIPLDYSRIASPNQISPIYDLVLVGRLHPERGVSEAVSIFKRLSANNSSLKILIVGHGPEENGMKFALYDLISIGVVTFTGFVNSSDLKDIYSKSKVLLSCAPREGYGLTLREAALSGLQVVARSNHGSYEASLDFADQISLYEEVIEAVSTIESALRKKRDFVPLKHLIKAQQEREKFGIEALISSWIEN